jgi:hypothetical protein
MKVVRFLAAPAVGAALITAAPAAHADGWGEAWYPGQNAACSSNHRIGDDSSYGKPTSIYDDKGEYWGWAEWRQGTSGSCAGYQWARLHVTESIPLVQSYLTVHLAKSGGTGLRDTRANLGANGIIDAGTYDSTVLYAPCCASIPITGTIDGTYAKHYIGDTPHWESSRLFFGHGGTPELWKV